MSEYPPVSEIINECLRCHHKWITRVTNPKRCPKCKSPYWNKPTERKPIVLNTESMSTNRTIQLQQEVNTLYEEIADKNKIIKDLHAERLPTSPLSENPTINLLPKHYSQLKSHLSIAMRDKYPKIVFELKGNEIIEIL